MGIGGDPFNGGPAIHRRAGVWDVEMERLKNTGNNDGDALEISREMQVTKK